jgi:hypothetical protein
MQSLGITWQGLIPTLEAIKEQALSIDQLRELIPDVEARTGVISLMQNLDQLKTTMDGMQESAGSMQEAYAKMKDTPANQLKLLSNEVDQLRIQLGAMVGYGLLPAVQVLRRFLDISKELPTSTKVLTGAIVAVTGAAALWHLGLGQLIKGLAGLAIGIVGVLPKIGLIIGGLNMTAASAGMAAIAVKALMGAFAIGGAVAIGWAAVELYKWGKAASDAARVARELDAQLKGMKEQFTDFADFKLPENIMGRSAEEVAEFRDALGKARAYWTAIQIDLQKRSSERTFLGEMTDDAQQASHQLLTANDRLKEIEIQIKSLGQTQREQKAETGENIIGLPDISVIQDQIEREKLLLTERIATIETLAVRERTAGKQSATDIFNARAESQKMITDLIVLAYDTAVEKYSKESEEYKAAVANMKSAYNDFATIRQTALKQYEDAVKRVQNSEKQWADYIGGIEKELADIRVQGMDDFDAALERSRQARQAIAEAERLANSDNIEDQERSKQLLEDARAILKENVGEVKLISEGEEQIVTTREDSIREYEIGLKRIKDVAETLAQSNIQGHKDQAEAARQTFEQIDSQFTELTDKMKRQLDEAITDKEITVKVAPDFAELQRRFNDLCAPQTKEIHVREITEQASGGPAGFRRIQGHLPGDGQKDRKSVV